MFRYAIGAAALHWPSSLSCLPAPSGSKPVS